MAAVAALAANAQLARVERDVVKNHQHLFRRQLVKGHGLLYGLAAQVHEGGGFQEQHFFAAQHSLAAQALEFNPVHPCTCFFRDDVQRDESGVVAGIFILAAGIAQTDNQKLHRPGRHCGAGRKEMGKHKNSFRKVE